ncbi:hypothetical protein GFS31_06280 [Leptolyngbya sp. BL0902]|nr:hypothetical protein GFS31_06280 [Leptolyngbya sp. BL0902]
MGSLGGWACMGGFVLGDASLDHNLLTPRRDDPALTIPARV